MEKFKYAIQHKITGHLIDYCETEEQCIWFRENYDFEVIEIENASSLEVHYIELGGPNSYGCDTPEFTTYGGIIRCLINLGKWMKSSASTFGPDPREIRDFFRKCRLTVNGEDKTNWFLKQVDKINMHQLYV